MTISSRNPRRKSRFPGWVAIAALVATGLTACGENPGGRPVPNQAPRVQFTGGPAEGSDSSYRVRIYWHGWDDDGYIDRYEYALDPPPAFSREEISSPESFPGLVREQVIADGVPVTRVTKEVDGELFSFDYVPTPRTDEIFNVDTPDADSMWVGASHLPGNTYSGYHVLYLRARDNEEACSPAARTAFNAWTLVPMARIDAPVTRNGIVVTGENVVLSWGGEDPDPPRPFAPPVGYLIKFVDLRTLSPPVSIYGHFDPEKVMYQNAAHIPWVYRSADTTSLTLNLTVPGEYLFAVRAVDEMGAIEPFIDLYRQDGQGNALIVRAAVGAGRPILTVSEPILGEFIYTGLGGVRQLELAADRVWKFSWQATAEDYGGNIAAYSWGIDLADLDAEGPGSGWSPWGRDYDHADILFRREGVHTLYVRARDQGGTMTMGSIVFDVAKASFDREVLFVDDCLDRTYPRDAEHDAFWVEMFENSDRIPGGRFNPETMWYETGGFEDRQYFFGVTPPSFRTLSRYQMVIWASDGSGYCARSGILNATATGFALDSYLLAGGKLWYVGATTLGATRVGGTCAGAPSGSTVYPMSFEPGDFAWDFLKVTSDRVENDKGVDWIHTLVGVESMEQVAGEFGDLEVDPGKMHLTAWRAHGVTHCEAIVEPIFHGSVPGATGDLDSLYAYRAAGNIRKPGAAGFQSYFHDKLCAIRWHDPDPDRAQGRIMWFGFPLYFMKNSQAQKTFDAALEWFQQEETYPPGDSP